MKQSLRPKGVTDENSGRHWLYNGGISFESPKILGQSVDILEYRPGIGVTAVFSSGMRVTFGDERSYEYKVAVLSNLLTDLQARGVAQPRAVDLRFGERVTYE